MSGFGSYILGFLLYSIGRRVGGCVTTFLLTAFLRRPAIEAPTYYHITAAFFPIWCLLHLPNLESTLTNKKKSHLRSSLEIGISFENGVVLFCKFVICSSVKYLEGISQKEKAINNSVNKQSAGVRRLYGMWPCQTGHPARAPVVKVSFSPQGSFHLSLFSSFILSPFFFPSWHLYSLDDSIQWDFP